MTLNPSEKNAFETLRQVLKLLNIKVTTQTLKKILLQHSDFPSLLSLSDALLDLKIESIATLISTTDLVEIPLPAVAHLEGGIGFIVILEVKENFVRYYLTDRGFHTESLLEFSQKWRGVVLLIQPNEDSGELNYSLHRFNEIIESLREPFIWTG